MPTRANGQPALAAYAEGDAYGVMVFALGGGRIRGIVGFADPSLFARFGLAPTLAPASVSSAGS